MVGSVALKTRSWPKRLVLAVPLTLLAVLLTFIPFVWPANQTPDRADAIVVLSGDHGERLPVALRLLERNVAPTLVFDGTPDRGEEEQLCREGWRGREVVCLRPEPDGTRPEAQAAGRLARERGWDRMIVVTSSHHAARSGLLFRRCIDGSVHVVPARRHLPWREAVWHTVREWAGTGYFLVFKRAC